MKKPHNVRVRRFALKAEAKQREIWCDSAWDPIFDDSHVLDNCDLNAEVTLPSTAPDCSG
jgi:hypothetical protein